MYLRTAKMANLDYLICPQLPGLFINFHTVVRLRHAHNSQKIGQNLYSMLHLPSSMINDNVKLRGDNVMPFSREGNPHQHCYTQLPCEYRVFSQCE